MEVFVLEIDYHKGQCKAHKTGHPHRWLIILLLVGLSTSHQRESLGFMQWMVPAPCLATRART
jgi:hypothetical protein